MSSIRVTLNHGGMRSLLDDPGVRADLTNRMGRVLAVAQAGAPVDTGDYKASIHIEQDTTDRAAVRVVADDWKSHIVESKTGNLARALDAAGGS